MAEQTDYSKYILPGAGALALFLVAKKFGLIPSAAAAQREKNAGALDRLAWWKPQFAKAYAKANGLQKYKTAYMPSAGIVMIAEQLKKAKGTFNDDESAVYTALKQLQYKSQLSQLAEYFLKHYRLDLVTYLQTFMNQDELAKVYDLTADLETGITQA
jgi:hypothetical protein